MLKIVCYLCMLKMILETFALSFFWKYFLSPASAVMAAILMSRYDIGMNNEMQEEIIFLQQRIINQ